MKDRVVEHPNRYRLVPVAGEPDVVDLVPVPGEITEAGTPISKATLLSDQTAALYGMGAGGVPDQVLQYLHEPVRQLWRYEAFMTKANANALDAAFGKGQAEGDVRDMGKLLNLYHHAAGGAIRLIPNLSSNTDQGYAAVGTATGSSLVEVGAPYQAFNETGGWGARTQLTTTLSTLVLDITFPAVLQVKRLTCSAKSDISTVYYPQIKAVPENGMEPVGIDTIVPTIYSEKIISSFEKAVDCTFVIPCPMKRASFTLQGAADSRSRITTQLTKIIFSGENEDLSTEILNKNTFPEICQSAQCCADISENAELLALVNSSPWAKSIFNFYNSLKGA